LYTFYRLHHKLSSNRPHELKEIAKEFGLSFKKNEYLAGRANIIKGSYKRKDISIYDQGSMIPIGYRFDLDYGAGISANSTYIYIDKKQIFPTNFKERKILSPEEIKKFII